MNIFISYSTEDLVVVKTIAAALSKHAQVFYWDQNKQLGADSWNQIFGWIDQANLVLVIITDKTVKRAMSVGQEIGRAKTKSKTIVPLVGAEVASADLGCLAGLTYQQINPNNPMPAITMIEKHVLTMKLKDAEANQTLLLLGGIVVLMIALSKG